MLETALVAFTTFFATVGPPDVAAVFAALTANDSAARRRRMALRTTLIATAILLAFAVFGRALLESFGMGLLLAALAFSSSSRASRRADWCSVACAR